MVCSYAAIVYTLSNSVHLDVNRFNRRDCDVNPEEHERLINDDEEGDLMKSQITKNIEYLLFQSTHKLGTYGCREVKIGGVKTRKFITDKKEFVDYMTITSDGEITCYEIKSSLEDIKSNARLSFFGHKNYFIMPKGVYEKICNESWFLRKLENQTIGVISVNDFDELKIIKKCKRKKLSIGTQTILLESFAKSTARDTAKLYQLEKETFNVESLL